MEEKNRRLMQGEDIIYPFTRQENVIGLQKTIKEKMTIASKIQPQGTVVERQVWLQTEDDGEASDLDYVQPNDIVENNFEAPEEENNFGGEEDTVENNFEGVN